MDEEELVLHKLKYLKEKKAEIELLKQQNFEIEEKRRRICLEFELNQGEEIDFLKNFIAEEIIQERMTLLEIRGE